MTAVLAIDPGYERSAWLSIDRESGAITNMAISPNEELLQLIRFDVAGALGPVRQLVIEQIESMGMAVGREVFETVYWSGRFAEAAHPVDVARVTRHAVKLHLTGSRRSKDPNIRQALIDRFGPSREKAIGKKAAPGPLYGIHGDLWSALAVGVTWLDEQQWRTDQGLPA